MNSLVQRIIKTLAESAQGIRISDVRIGLRYIGVQLDNGSIGVSYNFPENVKCESLSFPDQQRLANRNAADVLPWLLSDHQIHRSLGLAVANGLATSRKLVSIGGDIRLVARIHPGDRAVMVGNFEPIANDLREDCVLLIYDLKETRGTNRSNSPPVEEALTKSDVALISATSIINGTAESLLDAAIGNREVVILGPSTPLVPEAFANTPVTLLSGVCAENPEVLSVISEGGGMQTFKPYVRKVNCRLK